VPEIIYLQPGQQIPDFGRDEHWLAIEASDDGRFFGTGYAHKETGEGVFYASLPESDVSLEVALEAAEQWAAKYQVLCIWVQAAPD
jgi:hypothetical protein